MLQDIKTDKDMLGVFTNLALNTLFLTSLCLPPSPHFHSGRVHDLITTEQSRGFPEASQ
ncbi:uncharacterized protein SETTUDRAFT_162301 [Exserohilum turcica Et28A]|uniref:Uncharacterized protein n=1 Tax=Exserohilum turcicum (strain 28A) TaxID=671987 RepID=R0J402_EXST2|nr:uncharacterized protein SETTUDRAFT_162301 [Exserohilum turcica Et28A]EOA91650.1 hypothetical protein SETTUDRAFT_162301 [Exserohilum turcica Et28A]